MTHDLPQLALPCPDDLRFATGDDGIERVFDPLRGTHDFVGIVLSYDAAKKRAYFEQRNNVKTGEPLELLMPNGQLMPYVLTEMQDEEGVAIDCAPHAQQHFSAHSDVELLPFSLLRRKVVKE